jgi:hypothetical protein
MRIRVATDPLEGSIEVNHGELRALIQMIEVGAGQVAARVGDDPDPYSDFLGGVEIRCTQGGPVCVAVDWSDKRLVITGGHQDLRLLAEDLSGVSAAPIGSHHHFEYLLDDSYFGEESAPIVVQLVE